MKPAFCAPSSVELKWNDGKESAGLLALCSIRSTPFRASPFQGPSIFDTLASLDYLWQESTSGDQTETWDKHGHVHPTIGWILFSIFTQHLHTANLSMEKQSHSVSLPLQETSYPSGCLLKVFSLLWPCPGLPSSSFPPPLLSQAASVSVAHRPRGRLQHRWYWPTWPASHSAT